MLTAAITAAIAAILNFFGIEPGPYLVGVAVVVKVVIVGVTLLFGAKVLKKRIDAQKTAPTAPTAPTDVEPRP